MLSLEELDAVEILVLIDNELDPISKPIDDLEAFGNLAHIGMTSPYEGKPHGESVKQLKMEQICCGAHGLSLLIVCSYLAYGNMDFLLSIETNNLIDRN
jgi:7,8-dihydropterin-6-yl-methyl-4-(beta-D-ribofuranosyl)aminobenzene 5'-phosphate synthase